MQHALLRNSTRVSSRSLMTLTSTSIAHQLAQPRRFASTAPATIVDTGFWKSLIPKPLRKENRKALRKGSKKEWNPATFFIVIFLLIGSMSIQMIALRNSFQRYMRASEVKIGLLKEVVERIQNGEKFDVEQALGTGNAEKEADWEEVLRAIERGDASKKPPKTEKPKQQAAPEPSVQKETKYEAPTTSPTTASNTGKSAGGFGNFF